MDGYNYYTTQNNQKLNEYIMNNDTPDKVLKAFADFLGLRLEATTKLIYVGSVKKFLDYCGKDVNEINFVDYCGYMNEQQEFTSSRQIQVYSALKKFSKFLAVAGLNTSDSMKDIPRPKAVETQKTIKKRKEGKLDTTDLYYLYDIHQYARDLLSGEEFNEDVDIERWLRKPYAYEFTFRDEAIMKIFLSTGIRCAELFKLDVESYDCERQMLMVTTKGNRVMEKVLPDSACKAVDKWLELRRQFIDTGFLSSTESALFISNKGTRMSINSISKSILKYTALANDKPMSPHKLRATYITKMYEQTGDIYFTQMAVGHKSPSTTERYIRVDDEQRLAKQRMLAANLIDKQALSHMG